MYIHINYTLQIYIAGYFSIISFDDLTVSEVFRPQLRDSDMIPKLCEAQGGGGYEVRWVEPEVGSLNAPISESVINQSNWLIILLHH